MAISGLVGLALRLGQSTVDAAIERFIAGVERSGHDLPKC
jgi:hypothetical protein